MKKLLVVLLSLGLIAAFSMTASATDVKFSGQYYVTGAYESNRSLRDTDATNSLAAFYTRTRVQTVFKVAEGLTFTTRFDALEKFWGGVNQKGGVGQEDTSARPGNMVAAPTKANENVEFDHAYVTFKTGIGQFQVGYQAADAWGTVFADTPVAARPRIMYTAPFGPLTLLAVYEKVFETVYDSTLFKSGVGTNVDADWDNYILAGMYKFKGGDAGLLYKYINNASTRSLTPAYRMSIHVLSPYVKATFGPVYVEAELVKIFGNSKEYDTAADGTDVKATGLGAYAKARMNMGPAYFGAQVGFSSGNDPTTTKDETGPRSTTSWVPTLIFGESNLKTWIGGTNNGTVNSTTFSTDKQNLLLFNVFGGFNPTPKLNVEAAISTMKADKVAANYVSDKYGTEFDVTATYKIYDNLSYMVGAGYLWTGDYFKGTNSANKVGNDYLVLNKLTLNF